MSSVPYSQNEIVLVTNDELIAIAKSFKLNNAPYPDGPSRRPVIDGGAIRAVTKTAEIALKRKQTGIRYCAVITLDVNNAFNSVSWAAIDCAIHYLGVPVSLYRILQSYFQNRLLISDTDGR